MVRVGAASQKSGLGSGGWQPELLAGSGSSGRDPGVARRPCEALSREFVQPRFGFRPNAPQQRRVRLIVDSAPTDVEIGDHALCYDRVRTCVVDGRQRTYFEDGAAFVVSAFRAEGAAAGASGDGAITSPMPGRIIAVEVAAGASVAKGQKLVTLEAMKMEHTLTAPFDGVVAELNATPGAQVSEGTLLVRVEASGE